MVEFSTLQLRFRLHGKTKSNQKSEDRNKPEKKGKKIPDIWSCDDEVQFFLQLEKGESLKILSWNVNAAKTEFKQKFKNIRLSVCYGEKKIILNKSQGI